MFCNGPCDIKTAMIQMDAEKTEVRQSDGSDHFRLPFLWTL